jgi:aspartate racemase
LTAAKRINGSQQCDFKENSHEHLYQDCEMTHKSESLPFGLIAGLGVGGGIFYYRSLVNAHLVRGLSPNILMVHADVRRVMGHAAARETRELAAYLTGLLRQLSRGGAQLAAIPAFAPQICVQELSQTTPLPLVDLLDSIVAEVDRRRLQRLAIFGARVTMETKLFGKLENHAEVVSPSTNELDLVNDIYVRIVGAEHARPEDSETLRRLAHTLIEREHLDAILLAGTDFSFVFHPGNTDFSHVDGARIHVEAIMRKLAPQELAPHQ